jgi:hypothetical protein
MDIALQRSRIDTKSLSIAVWWAAMLVLCLVFATVVAGSIDIVDRQRGVGVIVAGAGYQPLVYRVLPIFVLRLMLSIGLTLRGGIWLIVAVSTVGAMAAFRSMCEHFDGYHNKAIVLVPLFMIFVIALRGVIPVDELYDMPTLALFTLAYVLMLRRRWMAYLAVFAVACLCKETAAFLAVGFAVVCFGKLAWRSYVALGAAQFAIWLIIRLAITWSFSSYPGVGMENHLEDHWFALTSLAGCTAAYGAVVAGVLFMMFRYWHEKPVELRRLFLAIAPLMAVLYLVGGFPFEFRVFYEIAPVTVLLLVSPSPRRD